MTKITLKGSEIHTNGELPKVGASAPNFSLVDSALGDRSLNDFKAKRKILSIVPSLDTGVCATSAKKFNAAISKHPEITLLVISADLPFAQKRFCELGNLKNLTVLSMMRNKDFAKNYGVLIQDGPLAGLCARAIVVLDDKDKVVYTELVPEIAQEPNYDKALQAAFKDTNYTQN